MGGCEGYAYPSFLELGYRTSFIKKKEERRKVCTSLAGIDCEFVTSHFKIRKRITNLTKK